MSEPQQVTAEEEKVPTSTEEMKDKEKEALAAYAADIEAVNKKHNMQIIPTARLEVQYIVAPKPVMELL